MEGPNCSLRSERHRPREQPAAQGSLAERQEELDSPEEQLPEVEALAKRSEAERLLKVLERLPKIVTAVSNVLCFGETFACK